MLCAPTAVVIFLVWAPFIRALCEHIKEERTE